MSAPPPVDDHVLRDAHAIRALAHPARLALLEHMALHGSLTATEAAEIVGLSPSACSFHLRQLAKYGFVEEEGGASGRRRPWKPARLGIEFDPDSADPDVRRAGTALARVMRERLITRYRGWLENEPEWPETWRRAAIEGQISAWLTPDELEAATREVLERLAALHQERLTDASLRPADSRPVEILLIGYPRGPRR